MKTRPTNHPISESIKIIKRRSKIWVPMKASLNCWRSAQGENWFRWPRNLVTCHLPVNKWLILFKITQHLCNHYSQLPLDFSYLALFISGIETWLQIHSKWEEAGHQVYWYWVLATTLHQFELLQITRLIYIFRNYLCTWNNYVL